MKTCLILIDSQESFRQRPYFTNADLPAYLNAQNALIDGCVASGIPLLRVFHVDGPKTADNPFALESGHIRLAMAQTALQSGRNVTQAAALAGFSSDTQLRRAWHQLGQTGTPSKPK